MQCIPREYGAKIEDSKLIVTVERKRSNGENIIVSIHLLQNDWYIEVNDKKIVPEDVNLLSGYFSASCTAAQKVLQVVIEFPLCIGVEDKGEILYSRRCMIFTGKLSKLSLCLKCRSLKGNLGRMEPITSNAPSTSNENKENVESKIEQLLKQIGLKEEQRNFMLRQLALASRHPTQRRYTKEDISTWIVVYNRDPGLYRMLRGKNEIIMPNPSVLQLYKNCLQQRPGINPQLFQSMVLEAQRCNIPTEHWCGSLILDEMSIAAGLQNVPEGKGFKLIGLVETGEECHSMKVTRNGKEDLEIADHVLQFLILFTNGFRLVVTYYRSTS